MVLIIVVVIVIDNNYVNNGADHNSKQLRVLMIQIVTRMMMVVIIIPLVAIITRRLIPGHFYGHLNHLFEHVRDCFCVFDLRCFREISKQIMNNPKHFEIIQDN